ncbi:MAG: hypothetical protein AMXMBFR23_16540 [Chloroflexota bacterium]
MLMRIGWRRPGLVVVVAASLLAGCSGDDAETSSATPEGASPAVTSTAAPSGGGGGGGGGGTGGGTGGGSGQAAATPEVGDVILTVRLADGSAVEWTLDRVRAELPEASMVLDGDAQTGVLLQDLLAASGVTDWTRIEVGGRSEGRAFEVGLTVTPGEIDEGWILDISNRGTLKLAADDLSRQKWVRDVNEIVVE